jgi:hypothetical protein
MRFVFAAAAALSFASVPAEAAVINVKVTGQTEAVLNDLTASGTDELSAAGRFVNRSQRLTDTPFASSLAQVVVIADALPNGFYSDLLAVQSIVPSFTGDVFGRATLIFDFTLDSADVLKLASSEQSGSEYIRPNRTLTFTVDNLSAGTSESVAGNFTRALAAGSYRFTASLTGGFNAPGDVDPFPANVGGDTATTFASLRLAFGAAPLPDPTPNPVPEPATWALMILGFALAGAAIRNGRSVRARSCRAVSA